MKHVHIGSDIPTTVTVANHQTLHINHEMRQPFSVDIRDIRCLYIRPPYWLLEGFANGYVYVSLDGSIENNPMDSLQTFQFTRWRKRDVVKFVRYLQDMNNTIEVIQVTQYNKMNQDPAVTLARTSIRCPSCRSEHIQYKSNGRKRFSIWKAVVGGLLTGGIGAVAGFAGSEGKEQWACLQCGKVFKM